MSFEATLTPDPFEQFAKLAALYGSKTVYEVIGASVAEMMRDHLAEKDALPNKTGFPKLHFYEGIARGTREEVDESGVSIVFPAPYRAKVLGAIIKPIHSKYLTIPMVAAAYGKRAGEFSGLEFRVLPDVGPALVEPGAEETPIFRLVRKVTVLADPTALPSDNRVYLAVKRGLDEIDV